MTELRSVGIVGLGLMGGSLAWDLAERGLRVLGADRDPGVVAAARADGVVAGELDLDESPYELDVDVLVLAVPVRAMPELLRHLAPAIPSRTLVTDLGSTKRSIVAAAEGVGLGDRFVGSHPIAGDTSSGWAAARAGLYRDATVLLTPTSTSRPEAIARAIDLWSAAGATTTVVDAAEHDRRLAWTSHLPQLAATALAIALDDATLSLDDLGPGGRDTTRLAASSPEMWTDIALDNAETLIETLGSLEMRLADLRRALTVPDEGRVRGFFSRGRDWSRGGHC